MSSRRSLRIEFLFNLTFLAAAALLLALWMARALERSDVTSTVEVILIAFAIMVFVLMTNHLIERWMLRPLAEIGTSAEAIAAGDYDHRVPEGGPVEIALLARALNELTEQLLQNQHRLAENVRSLDETNQQLTEAQRELVQVEKMASLGHLAAGIAHEIGNPLGALLGYVSVLERRGVETEILEGLEREAHRIDRIVRDLLDYARPGSAMPGEVDVNASVDRTTALLRDQGWLKHVEVVLDLQERLPRVRGDPHRFDQVLVNLISNAEVAMGGEGRITIVTRVGRYAPDRRIPTRRADDPPGVNYSHLRRGRHGSAPFMTEIAADREVVRLMISDTGPGIPESKIGSIFDPFFTTKSPGEGTGLGLAIVAGTIADLGGRIEASSKPEGGATFTLWIPTIQADS